jgi:DNA anti-recombination protein RmuC
MDIQFVDEEDDHRIVLQSYEMMTILRLARNGMKIEKSEKKYKEIIETMNMMRSEIKEWEKRSEGEE